MTLRLTNSLRREKQDFSPIDPRNVRMYVCGPTVYSYAHIGNARPAVVFDVLRRVLTGLYGKVTFVSNITDVDDKIMEASRTSGEAISVITRRYEDIYNADMAALGVQKPDVQPRATEHIPEMLDIIARLLKRGHAYEAEGHVMFNVPSDAQYGQLSGRDRDEQIAGARVDVAPYKKDPADFVLWKPSNETQVGWDSVYGRGRPGWHIECSAMAAKHLGEVFDIHGGGIDLTFPHHENELAQSCCAHGTDKMATFWVHNGFVTVEGEKMSKSIGNVLLVHDLLKDADGEAMRLALLSAHYRQPLDWTARGLDDATRTLVKFYTVLKNAGDIAAHVPQAFMDALEDDLNTPKAIAELHGYAKAGDAGALKGAGALLGLLQQDAGQWLDAQEKRASANLDVAEVERLIAARTNARANKDFAESDRLRDALTALGVTIKDGPAGTTWSVG